MSTIIAVVGTGTGVGKTHLACALVQHLRRGGQQVAGWKPVESGVTGATGTDDAAGAPGEDEAQLRVACGVSLPTLRLAEPLSPHLAARRQGVAIDRAGLSALLDELAARWPVLVVELAGGWFSPFDDQLDNADWLSALAGPRQRALRTLLVAPDRLGVLHEVSAACRAAATLQLVPAAIALSAPAAPDASSGGNAAELGSRAVTRAVPVVAVPRASVEQLTASPAIAELARHLLA